MNWNLNRKTCLYFMVNKLKSESHEHNSWPLRPHKNSQDKWITFQISKDAWKLVASQRQYQISCHVYWLLSLVPWHDTLLDKRMDHSKIESIPCPIFSKIEYSKCIAFVQPNRTRIETFSVTAKLCFWIVKVQLSNSSFCRVEILCSTPLLRLSHGNLSTTA